MKYENETRIIVAVDCIIFGFDGTDYKLLLIQRGFAPEKEKWSLMGGFLKPYESLDEAANRVLKELTGLENLYLEQMHVFSDPNREVIERTIAVAYVALIDIQQYKEKINDKFHAQWFTMKELPKLIFDHEDMVNMAKSRLRYKAALHPILFELLPERFTLPYLQALYESLYETRIDKRNFTRKVLSTNMLVKENKKDKSNSKKGAFYYHLDKSKYQEEFQTVLNFIPKNDRPTSND